MRLIEKSPQVSQREIAKKSGLSLGKVNYCLKSLGEKGLIKIKRFSKSEQKMGYTYLLTPEGIKKKSLMTIDFLGRKLAEYEVLQKEIEELNQELDTEESKDQQLNLKSENEH
jgi:MarR family transcriptional regulator, temperature-dependent positive regulator of motility